VFKWPQKKIAFRLNLHKIEVRQMIQAIESLQEFDSLKEDIFEAFCLEGGYKL
jgi:hypothetical protein